MSAPSRRWPNSSVMIDATELDALVIVGDDQHELFQDSMMPALGIYYGRTIRNAAR